MKLTENLPGINDRAFLVYLMSVDLNRFQGSGPASPFMVTKWLPQIQTSHPHQACPKTNSRATRAARMSFPQRPLFLPPPFFLMREKIFSRSPRSRCSLVFHWLEQGRVITPKQQGTLGRQSNLIVLTKECRQRQ